MKKHLFRLFWAIFILWLTFPILRVAASSASIDMSLDTKTPLGFNYPVKAIKMQSNGKLIFGWSFTTYQGVSVKYLVRLNADGTRDGSFTPWTAINSTVNAVAVQNDGKIVVGWRFSSGWVSTNSIVRLNADGSQDTSFNADCQLSIVDAITIDSDGSILVAGTSFPGWLSASNRIVRLNTDGTTAVFVEINQWLDWSWFPNWAKTIAVQSNGKILLGGNFSTYAGVTVNHIVLINSDFSLTSDNLIFWDWFDNNVNSIAIQSDGKIVVGGNFSTYDWSTANKIIRLSKAGVVDTTLSVGNGFDAVVNAITLTTWGRIVVGWNFTSYQWNAANKVVRLTTAGIIDTTFSRGIIPDAPVNCITLQSDGKPIVGQDDGNYVWVAASYVSRLTTTGILDTAFNIWKWFNGLVRASVIQSDGKIVIGGDFTSYGWVSAKRIVRLNTDGSVDTSFTPGSTFNSYIKSLAIQSDGKIIAGGDFSNKIIRLNKDGSQDTGFAQSVVNWDVYSLAIQSDGMVIAGGNFQQGWGMRIIRLTTTWAQDTSFDSKAGFERYVSALAVQSDGKILAGWPFTTYQWVAASGIIRLTSTGARDTSFSTGAGLNGWSADAITVQTDGKILVGGNFLTYNGSTYNGIVRLNANGTPDIGFNVGNGFSNPIVGLALQSDGKILAGGHFTSYNGTGINKLVRLNTGGTIDTSFDVWWWFNAEVNSILINPINGRILIWGNFTTYDTIPAGYFTALYGDTPLVSLPDSTNIATVNDAFTTQGYTTNADGSLVGNTPISLAITDGIIPTDLNLINNDIQLSVSARTQLQNDNATNYNGIIAVPTTKSISSVNDEQVIAAFNVGSASQWITLEWWSATLSIPVSQAIGSNVNVYYSTDNGVTWYLETATTVTENNGNPYVVFTTNHFANFVVTIPTVAIDWSFSINSWDALTHNLNVVLNTYMSPTPAQIRFSNDWTNRSAWESYKTTKQWKLPDGEWDKTVYIQFDINWDNASEIDASDIITYTDTTAPIGSVSYGSTTASGVVATLTLNETGTITNNSWSATFTFTGNGSFTFYFQDIVGNTGSTTAVVNWIRTPIGGNGGSASVPKDICLDWDDSPSYYDGICFTISTGTVSTGLVITSNTVLNQTMQDAYKWAFDNWITTKSSIQLANMDLSISRAEMAKMVSQYATKLLKRVPNTGAACKFSDISKVTPDLIPFIQEACQLGVMGLNNDGSVASSFNPFGLLTRGEFATALSRMLWGNKYNGGIEFYTNHIKALQTAKIITNTNPLLVELRGYVMTMLMRASTLK